MIYFDTSALVKLVWADEHSAELAGWLSEHPDDLYVSSTLAAIELRRTAWRVDPGAMGNVESVLAGFTVLPIDGAVVRIPASFTTQPVQFCREFGGVADGHRICNQDPFDGGSPSV